MTSYIEKRTTGGPHRKKSCQSALSRFWICPRTTRTYRQRITQLRKAIEDLSKGQTGEGFDKLDNFGAIQEIADDSGHTQLPLSQGRKFSVFARDAALGNA